MTQCRQLEKGESLNECQHSVHESSSATHAVVLNEARTMSILGTILRDELEGVSNKTCVRAWRRSSIDS